MWQKNQLRGVDVPILGWWKTELRWLDEAEDYLAAIFGESEAALFRAQEPTLDSMPQGKASLSIEVRTQEAMQLIRLKQDRLRKLRDNL
jgi:hypothetical protein